MEGRLPDRAVERGAVIVAGFGFRAGAGPASLADALARARAAAGAAEAPARLATAEDKAREPGFAAFARAQGLPVAALPPEALAGRPTETDSPRVRALRGTGSLAEAAALAAAGPGAALLGPRAVAADGRATCALARGKAE
jgi:cobalt-precorrin 5A hydrolase